MKFIKTSDSPVRYIRLEDVRELVIDTTDNENAVWAVTDAGKSVLLCTCANSTEAELKLTELVDRLNEEVKVNFIKTNDDPVRYIQLEDVRELVIDTLDDEPAVWAVTDAGKSVLLCTCETFTEAELKLTELVDKLNGGN